MRPAFLLLALLLTTGIHASAVLPQKGGEDITGPYTVVDRWMKIGRAHV